LYKLDVQKSNENTGLVWKRVTTRVNTYKKNRRAGMKNIVLVGDSIFDNAPYVNEGDSVSEQLSQYDKNSSVTLLAVDGAVTTDVAEQLKSFPSDTSHVFVSCGGNDALQVLETLNESVSTVKEGLSILVTIREQFRLNYRNMIDILLQKHQNLTLCTIYNKVPGISEEALTALALFNEVILEEAISKRLSVIDLRNVCQDEDDYSPISPIEPSGQGAFKIAKLMSHVSNHKPIVGEYSAIHI
jgi:lysophospholipase L1-like esterase